MKMKMKKFLIAALTLTMIMGSSTMAFAANEVTEQEASGNGSGSGDGNAVAVTDIFRVVVPTGNAQTFDYVLDPMGVISDTNAKKYGGVSFEPGQKMYFKHAATSAEVPYIYTSRSDALKVINKSNVEVKLTLTAEVTDTEQVSYVDATGSLNAPDKPQVHFDAVVISSTEPRISTTTKEIGTTSSATLTPIEASMAQATNAYVTSYDAGTDAYTLDLKPNVSESTAFKTVQFALSGSCNSAEKWGEVTKLPTPKLVWKVTGMAQKEVEDDGTGGGTSASGTYKMTAGSAVNIPLPAGKTVNKVEHQKADNSWATLTVNSDYAVVSGNLNIFKSRIQTWIDTMPSNSKNVRVTYTDGNSDTFILTK